MERSTAGNQPQSSSSSPPSPPPRYKGVRMRKWGSWVAEVRFPNSRGRLWLGSYPTAEQAARAFDAAVYCLRGPGTAFNFPDRPPVIPSADKLSKEEIRAAAERFANEEPRWPGKAQEEEGAGEKVTEVEGSSGTIAEPVEEMSMEHCSPAAAGVAEWWNEEDVDACWNAAASSSDDIYRSSPLWNF